MQAKGPEFDPPYLHQRGIIMVARNDITGDTIQTKGVSNNYRDNYDNIFRKNKKTDAEKFDEAIMKNEYYEEDTDGQSKSD